MLHSVLVSCLGAGQLYVYDLDRLHPSEYLVNYAVLSDTLKWTLL